MSSLPLVFFDASISNNRIGIGIYKKGTKKETGIRYRESIKIDGLKLNSSTAERVALVRTLRLLKENGIVSAHLFTDNIDLAHHGISEKLKKEFTKISLNWLPRELNQSADKLSKEAHQLNFVNIYSKSNKKITKTLKNTNSNSNSNSKNTSIDLEKYRNLSIQRRKEILKKIAHKETIEKFIEGEIQYLQFGKRDILFFQTLKILFCESEYKHINLENIVKKYINISNSKVKSKNSIYANIVDNLYTKLKRS